MTTLSTRTPEGAQQALGPVAPAETPERVRVMSYNIQTGLETVAYHQYVTRGWRHFVPHGARQKNLDRIALLMRSYDFVGLQEVDAGSYRSGYINQVEYLAHKAQFPYWVHQTNRNFGRFAQHSNGLLSRFRPTEIQEHRLPGRLPGRGALLLRFGGRGEALNVILVHMALGRRTRMEQLAFLADLCNAHRHVIVMGDFNCLSTSPELERLRRRADLAEPLHELHTFPSWKPARNIDHILVSSTLTVHRAEVLPFPLSDHLPITMELELPQRVELAA